MMKGFCFYNIEWHAARPEWSSSRKMDRQKAKAFFGIAGTEGG